MRGEMKNQLREGNCRMKRMSALFVFLSMLLLPTTALFAGTISGKIADAENQDPLIGANVMLEGTSLGAATDMEGYFKITNVPEGRYTLVASYIGYQTKQLTNLEIGADEQVNRNPHRPDCCWSSETLHHCRMASVQRKSPKPEIPMRPMPCSGSPEFQ